MCSTVSAEYSLYFCDVHTGSIMKKKQLVKEKKKTVANDIKKMFPLLQIAFV